MEATLAVARTAGSTGSLSPSVIRRWVERTCAAQGVRVAITDSAAIAQLVVLFGVPDTAPSGAVG